MKHMVIPFVGRCHWFIHECAWVLRNLWTWR